jgi:hypothetical protein
MHYFSSLSGLLSFFVFTLSLRHSGTQALFFSLCTLVPVPFFFSTGHWHPGTVNSMNFCAAAAMGAAATINAMAGRITLMRAFHPLIGSSLFLIVPTMGSIPFR